MRLNLSLLLLVLWPCQTLFAQASVSVHLTLGNPSQARVDAKERNNYLLVTEQWACSYNNATGSPNWVSWHLSIDDFGDADRAGLGFTADPDLPSDFPKITSALYAASGFDRFHWCPFADRSHDRAAQKRTFSTANCSPGAPTLNRGQWSAVEDLRRQGALQHQELFIVAGPAGSGGQGEHGYRTSIGDEERQVNVPAFCWAAWISVPHRRTDALKRITKESEVCAVIFRNDQQQLDNWQHALTTVDDIEQLTKLDLFDLLPENVEHALEARRPSAE